MNKKIAGSIAIIFLLSSLMTTFAYSSMTITGTPSGASYLIEPSGSSYVAISGTINGATDQIESNWTSTDAAVTINDAIKAMPDGGTVYLSDSLFLLSSTIDVPGGVNLQGQGPGAGSNSPGANLGTTLELANGADCNVITFTALTSHDYFGGISNLIIVGNMPNEVGTSYGVYSASAHSDWTLYDCAIENCLTGGIYVTNTSSWYDRIYNCWIEANGGDGITLYNMGNMYIGPNNVIKLNDQNGISMSGSVTEVNVNANQDMNNLDSGISVNGSAADIFIQDGNVIQYNDLYGIYTSGINYNIQINGNMISYNDETGCQLVSTYDAILSGNTIQYNSQLPTNTYCDLNLWSVNNVTITDNVLGASQQGAPSEKYVILEQGNIPAVIECSDNDIGVGATGVYDSISGNGAVIFWSNLGYGPIGYSGLASLTSPVTISSASTETQLIGWTIPANMMDVGQTYEVTASGIIGSYSTAPTLQFQLRIGSTTLTGTAIGTLTPVIGANVKNQGWNLVYFLTVDSIDSAPTVTASGYVEGMFAASSAWSYTPTTTTVATALGSASTISNMIQLTFKFGSSNSADTLTCVTAEIQLIKS